MHRSRLQRIPLDTHSRQSRKIPQMSQFLNLRDVVPRDVERRQRGGQRPRRLRQRTQRVPSRLHAPQRRTPSKIRHTLQSILSHVQFHERHERIDRPRASVPQRVSSQSQRAQSRQTRPQPSRRPHAVLARLDRSQRRTTPSHVVQRRQTIPRTIQNPQSTQTLDASQVHQAVIRHAERRHARVRVEFRERRQPVVVPTQRVRRVVGRVGRVVVVEGSRARHDVSTSEDVCARHICARACRNRARACSLSFSIASNEARARPRRGRRCRSASEGRTGRWRRASVR